MRDGVLRLEIRICGRHIGATEEAMLELIGDLIYALLGVSLEKSLSDGIGATEHRPQPRQDRLDPPPAAQPPNNCHALGSPSATD